MVSTASGPVNCCVAQLLLELKGISTISPLELGEMMNCHHTRAAWILKTLSWRRDCSQSPKVFYHYTGIDKIFYQGVLGLARKRLARLLGVTREEVLA